MLTALLGSFAGAGAALADVRIREGGLPARGTEIGDRVPANYRAFYCGGVGFVDAGAAVDGPSYYFRRSDGRILGACGGACWRNSERCRRQCPPAEWTCRGNLPRNAFYPNNERR
jgi:hypothetical protein